MLLPDDHERFMRLFLQHEPDILRSVLVFVPHRADARDIVQETAVALWKRFEEYDPARPFTAWACGFARIEMLRFLRRSHQRAQLSAQAAVALMVSAQGRAGDDEQRERHLSDCLCVLPSGQRLLVEGYYFDDKPVDVLAREQGKTVEAVYKLLQRVRHALLKCMQRKSAEACS